MSILTRFPCIYGFNSLRIWALSIKNSRESFLINALAIETSNNECLVVKTGDLNHDFQKSATCRDTVGNSSFNWILWSIVIFPNLIMICMIYFNVRLNKNKRVEIPWTSIVFKNPIHEESVYVANRITQNANRVFFNLEFAHTHQMPRFG